MSYLANKSFVYGITTGSLPAVTASTLIVNEHTDRKGLLIQNDSPNLMFLAFGEAATYDRWTVRLPAYSLYEMIWPPVTCSVYAITGASNSGSIRYMHMV